MPVLIKFIRCLGPILSNAISYALKEATKVDEIPALLLAAFKDDCNDGSKSVVKTSRRRLKNHRLVIITSIAAIVTDLINQVLKIMPHQDNAISLLISLIETRHPSNLLSKPTDPNKSLTNAYANCKITPEPNIITRTLNLLILGIEDSGKSTLLAALGGSKDPSCKTTLGFRPISLRYNDKITIRLNDVGGQKRIRGIWENYYQDSHGIIFVLDASCSKEKLDETVSVAKSSLSHRFLQGKPLLVICNKEDRPEVRPIEAVKENLHFLPKSDKVLFIKTSIHPKRSYTYKGRDNTIDNAIEWIIARILDQVEEIEERISNDRKEVYMLRRKRKVSSSFKKIYDVIELKK